jgi:hypothetical protein
VFACAGLAYLAHERFSEARRRQNSRDLLLALGDLEVALHVADGPEAAKQIANQLAPYSRDAPITRPEVFEDAKRRMRAQAEGKGEASAKRDIENALVVGTDVVYLRGEYLQVGQVAFRITEVREYALRGANLPLTGGRLLQAAMGLLVVAAETRAKSGEDVSVAVKNQGTRTVRWTASRGTAPDGFQRERRRPPRAAAAAHSSTSATTSTAPAAATTGGIERARRSIAASVASSRTTVQTASAAAPETEGTTCRVPARRPAR